MREIRSYGSVRGVPGNRHSYRNHDQQYPGVKFAIIVRRAELYRLRCLLR